MPIEANILERYFDQKAASYDAIYSGETSTLANLKNRIFHRDVYRRFTFAINQADKLKSKRILDVGCGSGRYAVEAARKGAQHVFGIDLSAEMLKIAASHAKEQNVSERCKFVQGDFLQHSFQGDYDITFALGVFALLNNARYTSKVCRAVLSQE